jgi:flagellar motor switch protein FliN/FliY
MMATAAGAISTVLDTAVEIGTPETRTYSAEAETEGAYPASPHMVRAAFSVCGEPCRLVQLVPNAFVVRMDRALDELGAETAPAAGAAPVAAVVPPGAPSLAGIPVRVWAELGRASMPTADVVGLPHGAVVELDKAPDEPIDLFVNGRRFATGRLVVVDGDWAVRIESVLPGSSDSSQSEGEVARWPVSS